MPLYNGGRIGLNNKPFTGTKSDDPNYSNVSLLLNGNGTNGSTTFTDSSSYGHTVTPNGNAQISTAQSKFGGASMYFDGSGDYLSIPTSDSFDFGSGDFTVEFWIYFSNLAGLRNIFNKRSSTGQTQWIWFSTSNNTLVVYITSNGSSWDIALNFSFGTTVTTGQWYHIALIRNGTEIACYVNGTKSANTITTSSSINFGSENLLIGGDVLSYQTNGYIDDLRITKGVARYTSNFTPPTAQLPGVEAGTIASGLWTLEEQSVAIRKELWPGFIPGIVTDGLVLNLDAGDTNSYPGSGTTWFDLSGSGNDGTINGATYSSNNGGYFDFDGTNDYVTMTASSDFNFGTGDLSIEAWIYWDGTYASSGRVIYATGGSGSLDQFGIFSGYGLIFGGVYNNVAANYPPINTWSHVATTRIGTTIKIYINGVETASGTQASSIGNSGVTAYIGYRGADGNHPWSGKISNLRIYKGKGLTASEVQQNFNALKGRYGL